MTDVDRRGFVGAGAMGLLGMVPRPLHGGVRAPGAGVSVDGPTDVTRTLAAYVVAAKPDDLPAPVRAQACRTLLNWAGCAVGGSGHETVDIAVRTVARFAGPPQASVVGRRERMDILHAALINGISS